MLHRPWNPEWAAKVIGEAITKHDLAVSELNLSVIHPLKRLFELKKCEAPFDMPYMPEGRQFFDQKWSLEIIILPGILS